MSYLLHSIVSSSLLVLIFKFSERFHINFFQQIVFNYLTASVIGWVITGPSPVLSGNIIAEPWLPLSIFTGIIFIIVFNAVAIGVKKSGVTAVAVAQKMSLVIPVLFSVWMFDEQLGWLKVGGILLAIMAILFSSGGIDQSASTGKAWLFPLIIFIGSGIIDSSIKYSQVNYLEKLGTNLYITILYTIAALIGIMALSYLIIVKKERIAGKNILAGIALGIPNYVSMYAIVKALDEPGYESSMVFPVNNMGIIIFSSVIAWLAFGEKLSRIKIAGILIALLAIALISFA